MTVSIPSHPELSPLPRIRQWVRDFFGEVRVDRGRFYSADTGEFSGVIERWYTGRRLDAVKEFLADGSLRREQFFGGEPVSRIGGRNDGEPGDIRYHPDGRVDRVRYVFEGEHHRLDGPAIIGKPPGAGWYYLGKEIRGPVEVGNRLADEEPERALEIVRASRYRTLLDEGIEVEVIIRSLCAGITAADGMRQVAEGTPAEWIAAFEEGEEV